MDYKQLYEELKADVEAKRTDMLATAERHSAESLTAHGDEKNRLEGACVAWCVAAAHLNEVLERAKDLEYATPVGFIQDE